MAEAIAHDPRLRDLKLVALASDSSLLPRSGARGFPHWGLWMQRNTGFGADLMAYLAEGGRGVLAGSVGVRLPGVLWSGRLRAPAPCASSGRADSCCCFIAYVTETVVGTRRRHPRHADGCGGAPD